MSTLLFVILVIVSLILVFSLASVLTLLPNYIFYKKIYNELENTKFYLLGKEIITSNNILNINKPNSIEYFLNEKHIKLRDSVYLHSGWLTFLDPYSYYWLLKYRKWFKENIKVEELEEWSAAYQFN